MRRKRIWLRGLALPCQGGMSVKETPCVRNVMGGRHAWWVGISAVFGEGVAGKGVLVSSVVEFVWAGVGPPCGGGVFGVAVWGWRAKEVCPSKESHVYAVY